LGDDYGDVRPPHPRTAEEIRMKCLMGRRVISIPALLRITDILYSLYIVNGPFFISCCHIRNVMHHLCAGILMLFVYILMQCMFVQYTSNLILLLLFLLTQCMLIQDTAIRINIVLSSWFLLFCIEFKYRMVRIGTDFVRIVCVSVCRRCIGRYVESAVRAHVSWQVKYGTVRRVCEWLVHSRVSRRGARRAGTEEVSLAVRVGVVVKGSVGSHKAGRLVSRCQLWREDTARELNKSTCATSAGKCWDRIGTSTSAVFTFFL
jgi:hypothetical protein